jgi:hypothetical protein
MEWLELRKRQSELLGGQDLNLDDDWTPSILKYIDCFVSQSRGNEIVEAVHVYTTSVNGQDDDAWESRSSHR